jgi:hypothetical protein
MRWNISGRCEDVAIAVGGDVRTAIFQSFQRAFGLAQVVAIEHSDTNIDYRNCGEPRNGRAADVFHSEGHPPELFGQAPFQLFKT